MIRLTVHDGKIVQTLTVDEDKIFIGRLPSNTISVHHASVSRKHCMLRRDADGELEVLDLNSQHGTRVGGQSVDRAVVRAGDELRLGEVRICVEELFGAPSIAKGTNGPEAPEPTVTQTETAAATPKKAPAAGEPPAKAAKELISAQHRTDFGTEVTRQLQRTPWWATSLFGHTLLVYLFFLVPFGPRDEGSPFGAVNGSISEDFSSLLNEVSLKPRDLRETLASDLEKLDNPTLREDPPLADEKMIEPEENLEPLLPDLGVASSDFSARIDVPTTSTALNIPDAEFGQSGAADANRQAMALLRNSGGGSLAPLRKLRKRDILVVEGHYDSVEKILEMLDLNHDGVSAKKLEQTRLTGRKVLMINCTNQTPSQSVIKGVREFVEAGGYLVTTDWALDNVIRRAFPQMIRPLMRSGRNVITPNEVVGIHAVGKQRSHFLLAGTQVDRGDSKWWLEESSYPIEVVDENAVEVLIESDEMKARYGASAVAVTFQVGEGRVLHMLGHFFQKEGNLKGTFSTQRLIANFLMAAVRGK